jgi:ATP-dependent helicase Lhr and Lhr-like helicase
MSRERRSPDWTADLAGARPYEAAVRRVLREHPSVSRVADLSEQTETPDFEFEYEGHRVGLEVKTKLQSYSPEVRGVWPEIDERRLFILDEVSLRKLFAPEGMGYLLVYDAPGRRWVVFGPWHLLFGPHRRYERSGDKGNGPFLKGKMLIDLDVAVELGVDLDVDAFLRIVRRVRRDTTEVRAIRVRNQAPLPVVPKLPGDRKAPLDLALVGGPSVTAEPPAEPRAPDLGLEEFRTSDIWMGLDQALADALASRFSWSGPTPVQAASFPPVLNGDTTLVLAPTAGGKTEAALLPLLDVARRERWSPLSIVAVSPMKALLDDQLRRYAELGELTGATAFAWHGDTPSAARRSFLDGPTDLLLTTPESLEILLHNNDAKSLFNFVRAVIVDEVHAFVGTARGAQLAAVLERMSERSSVDVQRVGLSATVGSPDQVLAWLGGSSHRPRSLAQVPAAAVREETNITTYEDDAELVGLLGGVMAEQRTLLFVQSRRRAEELGRSLELPVHHSSVHVAGRQSAVDRFRRGEIAGIVATATLELGIDIGDVELVAQDGAPSGPASYLQRVGRSGRRSGFRRMLFTCGSPDDLLQVLAVLARVRRSALEASPARRGARLVLGQQALALVLDPTAVGMSRSALASTIGHTPVFRGLDAEIDGTLDHLLAGGWLVEFQGLLMAGAETQQRYGGRGRAFADLAVSFESNASIAVVTTNGAFVGFIDWSEAQADKRIGRGEPFTLGGESWRAVDVIDGAVKVEPAKGVAGGRAPSWRGRSLDVDRETWETAREVLAGTDVPSALDDRGAQWLGGLRAQWAPRLASPVVSLGEETSAATFCGAAVHRSVLAMLGLEGVTDGPTLRLSAQQAVVRDRSRAVLDGYDDAVEKECLRLAPTVGTSVKHGGLVPESVLAAEAREFAFDGSGVHKVFSMLAEN